MVYFFLLDCCTTASIRTQRNEHTDYFILIHDTNLLMHCIILISRSRNESTKFSSLLVSNIYDKIYENDCLLLSKKM
jgi:hypothetical protein